MNTDMDNRVQVPFEALSPVMEDCLEQGQEVVLTVTGSSMRPFLRHGRDRVVLVKPADPAALQAGDVPLYRRHSGQFVLHRIVERDDGHSRYRWLDREEYPSACVGGGVRYTLLGDAQTNPEPGIRPQQVVAVAKGFWIKNKYVPCDMPCYRRRSRRWHRLLPIRRQLMWLVNLPSRIPRIPARLHREWQARFGK